MYGQGRYEIEVWNKQGTLLGNIRPLARNLKYSIQRNQAETVEFTMDLAEYEEYISQFTDSPFDFMDVLNTDIRIKREGKYLFGANIIKFAYSPTNSSVNIVVSGSGYLNFFKSQYLDIAYTNVAQGEILWGVIDSVQNKDNGNYGITKGDHTSMGVNRDRNQTRKNVKDFMVQMTNVIDGPDFEFTADKKFNSYDVMGTYRPDIRLVYPQNVDSFSFERSGDGVFNYIYGIGSGNGEDAVNTYADDYDSQYERYLREEVYTFNSVEELETLQENTDGVLGLTKDIRELPSISVRDGILDLNTVKVGDTVYVELRSFKSVEHIAGFYRIERFDVNVDDNDAESVDITFDDLNIEDIIETQEGE